MSLHRTLLAAVPAVLLAALPLQAQQSNSGRIALPVTEGPTLLPPPVAPQAKAPAPAATPGLIILPQAEGEDRPLPDESPAVLPPELATRDQGALPDLQAEAPEPLTEGLMPLIPTRMVPRAAVAGAGLPQPGILRLTGERLSQDMTFYLPEGAPKPEKLQLTLQTSIHVLPEAASLQITVNDSAPQRLALDSVGAFSLREISGADLRPGLNRIRLDLRQPHRIWCGPEATFDVWTEIDLIRSGARLPVSAITPDPAGYALALRAQAGVARPLPVLISGDVQPEILRAVTDQVSEVMGGRGRITLRSFYEPGPKAYASVALITSDKNLISFRPGTSGALVMQIEHKPGELPDLAPYLPPAPPAVAGAQFLTPGQPVTLAELGYSDFIGNTHYYRSEAGFYLPEGWLLLANQRARLRLNYGFAADLPEGAILLVKVNDETVRLLPLDVAGGKVQPPLEISFPANLLHAGHNALSFEMMVPGAPENDVCVARPGDMLAILASSSLDVPPSPPMELSGLIRPFGALTGAGVLAAPGSDAATLPMTAARLSAGLSRPRHPDPEVRLFVTDLTTPESLPAGSQSPGLRRLQQVLYPIRPATAMVAPDATALPTTAPGFSFATDETVIIADEDLQPLTLSERIAERWRSLTEDGGPLPGIRDSITASAYLGERIDLDGWLEGRFGTALLLRPDPQAPNDLWLILGPRAPVDGIAAALSDLRSSRLASGEAALLTPTGEWEVWSPVRSPVMLGEPKFGQWRTVFGNYASWSPLLFTALTLGLALLSILPVLGYLLLTRTRRGGRG